MRALGGLRSLLRVARRRFQDFVLAHVEDKSQWCFPKFWNMRKYEDLIPMFGNVDQLSSAPGERSNAVFKSHSRFSNRHADWVQKVGVLASGVFCSPPFAIDLCTRVGPHAVGVRTCATRRHHRPGH